MGKYIRNSMLLKSYLLEARDRISKINKNIIYIQNSLGSTAIKTK